VVDDSIEVEDTDTKLVFEGLSRVLFVIALVGTPAEV